MLADARPQARKTGSVFAGIRWGCFRAENDPDAFRSFAAVEWHYSDRLLACIESSAESRRTAWCAPDCLGTLRA
jgi:hypothetical protein